MLAIGNPFSLEGTLTTGIISSLGRTIADEQGRELEGMLQTMLHPPHLSFWTKRGTV